MKRGVGRPQKKEEMVKRLVSSDRMRREQVRVNNFTTSK
jgi:hypothetical protein